MAKFDVRRQYRYHVLKHRVFFHQYHIETLETGGAKPDDVGGQYSEGRCLAITISYTWVLFHGVVLYRIVSYSIASHCISVATIGIVSYRNTIITGGATPDDVGTTQSTTVMGRTWPWFLVRYRFDFLCKYRHRLVLYRIISCQNRLSFDVHR